MIALLLACGSDPVPAEPIPPTTPATPASTEPTTLQLPPPGGPTILKKLEPIQGRWRSVEDERAEVLIIKSIWVEGYDGQEQSRGVLEWADGCRADGGKPSPIGTYLNLLGETPRCMQVSAVTEDALDLVELPEGNHRRFVRATIGGM